MKRLYFVTVETELYVVAESQAEAERAAEYVVLHDADGGFEVTAHAIPIDSPDKVAETWRSALPYGADPEDGEKTCAAWAKGADHAR